MVAGLPVLFLVPYALPPLRGHIGKAHAHPLRAVLETFAHANHLNAFALIIVLMIGNFTVFPYVPDYLVHNVGMAEEQLPWIYLVGGGLTLVAAPLVGWLADRFGKLRMYLLIAPLSAVLMLTVTQLPPVGVLVAVVVFGLLMVTNVGRMIPATAMVTGSVEPRRRGGFLSVNASLQHVASGVGAYLGGIIISQSARRADRAFQRRRLDCRRRHADQPVAGLAHPPLRRPRSVGRSDQSAGRGRSGGRCRRAAGERG